MNAVAVETSCPLEGRLKAFIGLYWWLDYWGNWVSSGGVGISKTPLDILISFGDERILATNPQSFPRDIEQLERGLGRLRISVHFQWQVLAYHHIARWNFREIASCYGIRQRGLERTLWRAYSFLDAHYSQHAPDLLIRSAPIVT